MFHPAGPQIIKPIQLMLDWGPARKPVKVQMFNLMLEAVWVISTPKKIPDKFKLV